jgi:hypothetical protein
MKPIAIALLALSMFVSGMCVQAVRDDIKTRNWINPDKVGTVINPFGPPTREQKEILANLKWTDPQLQEEYQADVAEGAQQ